MVPLSATTAVAHGVVPCSTPFLSDQSPPGFCQGVLPYAISAQVVAPVVESLILGVGEITGVGVGAGTGFGAPARATVTVTDADIEPPVPVQVTVY